MNKTPVVTAVIPVHNHRDWVNEAVDSVACQDYRPLRIVVVDDGSTDGSADAVLARLYKPKGPAKQGEPWAALGRLNNFGIDVMVQRFKESHGPAFARNWGVKVGLDGTDIFAFLDSDDVYYQGKVARSVAKFLDGPEVGAVYSDYDTFNAAGLRLRQYKEPFDRERLLRECIVNCDSLVSAAALVACGGFDDAMRVCEDYDLWLRLSEKYAVVHLAEALVGVRVGDHSSTSTVSGELWRACHARAFEKLRQRQ